MTRLIDCKDGSRIKIIQIDAGRGAQINLSNLGLHIGDQIKFERKSPLHGPVIVVHRGTEIAIGYKLAQKIFVELV
jgi:Fe2+ transport system protein FeoA